MKWSGAMTFRYPPGTHRIDVETSERLRDAILHVPNQLVDPLSFVFCFHGAGSNASAMVEFCGMNEQARQSGFVAVYPNGSGRTPGAGTWNGGPHCGFAGRYNVDDVGFVRQLIQHLLDGCSGGPGGPRFFATGMSNGGLMCYRLAEELSDWFPAIAPVAGTMGKKSVSPQHPVSVLHIHGTEDDFVPYDGGIGIRSLTRTPFVSVDESIRAWVAANGCHSDPLETEIPDQVKDGTRLIRYDYLAGREHSRVSLIRIIGGGHTWPGHPSTMRILGKTSMNIEANGVIWDFFATTESRKTNNFP